MFLVMGITGKVGSATAKHLLAHGKEVRALVRNREKAANWANQGVELVDGDWNGSGSPSSGRSKASKARLSCCRQSGPPRPDYKEAKGVIANYVEALTKRERRRGLVVLSSMDVAEQDQRAWDDHGLVASGARVSRPDIANRICARRWILRKLPLRLAGRPGRNATGLLHSDKPEIDHMVATNDIGARRVATL